MARWWDDYRDPERDDGGWLEGQREPEPFANPWDGDLPDPTPMAALAYEFALYLDVGERAKALKAMDYREEYLRSEHWQITRKSILAKRGRRCDRCGTVGKVDVHHLTYANRGAERDEDLQVICRPCHEREHG